MQGAYQHRVACLWKVHLRGAREFAVSTDGQLLCIVECRALMGIGHPCPHLFIGYYLHVGARHGLDAARQAQFLPHVETGHLLFRAGDQYKGCQQA